MKTEYIIEIQEKIIELQREAIHKLRQSKIKEANRITEKTEILIKLIKTL